MDSDPPLPNVYYAKNQWLVIVYNQNFYGGVVDGEGVAVKDASSGVVEGGH